METIELHYFFFPMGNNPVGFLSDMESARHDVFFGDDEMMEDYQHYFIENLPIAGRVESKDNEDLWTFFNRINVENWGKLRILF